MVQGVIRSFDRTDALAFERSNAFARNKSSLYIGPIASPSWIKINSSGSIIGESNVYGQVRSDGRTYLASRRFFDGVWYFCVDIADSSGKWNEIVKLCPVVYAPPSSARLILKHIDVSNGAFYVSYSVSISGAPPFTLRKYKFDGSLVWEVSIPSSDEPDAITCDLRNMTVDPDENVYFSCSIGTSNLRGLDSSGNCIADTDVGGTYANDLVSDASDASGVYVDSEKYSIEDGEFEHQWGPTGVTIDSVDSAYAWGCDQYYGKRSEKSSGVTYPFALHKQYSDLHALGNNLSIVAGGGWVSKLLIEKEYLEYYLKVTPVWETEIGLTGPSAMDSSGNTYVVSNH